MGVFVYRERERVITEREGMRTEGGKCFAGRDKEKEREREIMGKNTLEMGKVATCQLGDGPQWKIFLLQKLPKCPYVSNSVKHSF